MSWTFYERAPVLGLNNGNPLADTNVDPAGMYASVDYDDYELNNKIAGYSELSYEQYQLSVGGSYDFTERMYASASMTYDVFESDQTYVYGDEDGDSYYGYLGFGYRF